MKNYSELGTLLTREEAKRIRGGKYGCLSDADCPSGAMCYDGVCAVEGDIACPTSKDSCLGQECTYTDPNDPKAKPLKGTCKIDRWSFGICACVVS